MKTKNKIFFSDKDGITSTSAQHLCNIGREYIRSTEAAIKGIRFYQEAVSELSSDVETILQEGVKDISNLEENLLKVAGIHSFIAWMQEAIKAKDEELRAISIKSVREWAEEQGITYPIQPTPVKPITVEDKIAALSIKDRMRYYHLQAKAAVIGKAIHPDGPVHIARKELMDIQRNPNRLSGDKIFSRRCSISPKKVDECYFKLQKLHRETEASFNAIKGSMEKAALEETIALQKEYVEKVEKYNVEQTALNSQFTLWCKEETKTVSKLKIVIPNELKDTYEFLSNL